MPSSPSEEGTCLDFSGAITRAPAKVTSGSVPLPIHLIEKPKDECVDPAETSSKVIRIHTKGMHCAAFNTCAYACWGNFIPCFGRAPAEQGTCNQALHIPNERR